MQATWSQPVAEVVAFSNDFANREERPQAPVGDLDAPGGPNGAEDRLVVPSDPADLDVVLPTEVPRGSRGHPAVHQVELEPARDAMPGQVPQHQGRWPSWVEADTPPTRPPVGR